ncbi:MAG: hypothetical protein ACI4LB_08090 [Candidatus Fimenecus sp.]
MMKKGAEKSMDIGSLLGTLMDTLASLGIPVDSIMATVEPILQTIISTIGTMIGM